MTYNPIRVGFIGLSPGGQWASTAHIPALKSLDDSYAITGVANSSLESSQRAAAAFGIPHAFATAHDLVESSEIELVVVTVKVPHHLELVSAALNAGKHVYCEWPLGNGLAEAQELAQLAQAKGVLAVAGTQARVAPEVEHLRELVKEGFVGKLLSTTLIGSGGMWRGETNAASAYLNDEKNGATMLTIPLAHTLAALCEVLGPIGDLTARFVNQFDSATVAETGQTIPKTATDQIMVCGSLVNGMALSVHYRGGTCRGTNFLWEINGTDGDLQITSTSGHAQMMQLDIRGANGEMQEMVPQMPPASAYEVGPSESAPRNVAHMYSRIAHDIHTGSRTAPTFLDAVKLHELIDRIDRIAKGA